MPRLCYYAASRQRRPALATPDFATSHFTLPRHRSAIAVISAAERQEESMKIL